MTWQTEHTWHTLSIEETADAKHLNSYVLTWQKRLVIMPNMREQLSMSRRIHEERAKVIKALAHPSRLMMIDALTSGEKCVCELRELVGSDISTVSKHLALMKEAGIVNDRKAGQQVFYSLRVPCITNFFSCVEAVMKSNAKEKMELVG